MSSVLEYTDFRKYLRDVFDEHKKSDPKFSHRWLARRLDLGSPNFILLVIQGKRNIGSAVCFKLSQVFRHTKREARYFECIVRFAQTPSGEEKNVLLQEMLAMRRKLKIASIDQQQYEYYSNWYNPVIRELVCMPGFSGDTNELARHVSPAITPTQARQSVELLCSLGMIRKRGAKYEQTASHVSTGPEVNSVAVENFHRATARLAAESYNRHARTERTLTSCTVALTEEAFQQLKREAADLRKRALELADDITDQSRVYHLNLHLFPVSRLRRDRS